MRGLVARLTQHRFDVAGAHGEPSKGNAAALEDAVENGFV